MGSISITQQVATLRRKRNIPARVITQHSGVATSNIYAIENGRRDPAASTLERIANAAGVQLIAVDTSGTVTVAESARYLYAHVATGDPASAYRQLVQISDDLVGAEPSIAVILAHTAPKPGDPGWDAAVAGVVEWRLAERGLPMPAWLEEQGLPLEDPWHPIPVPYQLDDAEIAIPLLRRNVRIGVAELTSA